MSVLLDIEQARRAAAGHAPSLSAASGRDELERQLLEDVWQKPASCLPVQSSVPTSGRASHEPMKRRGRSKTALVETASSSETPEGRLQELELKELLGYQVAQATIVTLGVFEDVVGRPCNLRTVEYTVLALIRANGAVAPAQLAKALSLSPSYITMALDKLESMGLIKRETNETDRRGQRLHLTAKGVALAAETTQDLLRAEREAFITLSPIEQLMLGELLHKLAQSRIQAGRRVGAPAAAAGAGKL